MSDSFVVEIQLLSLPVGPFGLLGPFMLVDMLCGGAYTWALGC